MDLRGKLSKKWWYLRAIYPIHTLHNPFCFVGCDWRRRLFISSAIVYLRQHHTNFIIWDLKWKMTFSVLSVPFSWHAVWFNAWLSKLRYFAIFISLSFMQLQKLHVSIILYYNSPVYCCGLLCGGILGEKLPESCIENCIAVLWHKSGGYIILSSCICPAEAVDTWSWRGLRSVCQPCNEYPSGIDLSSVLKAALSVDAWMGRAS